MSDTGTPINDPYTLMLQTFGFQTVTKTGLRVVLSSTDAPIRATILQQHDPMELMRWSKDNDIDAIRVHVRNDFSVGANVYVTGSIIQFSTTPAIELLVEEDTCDLILRFSGGATIRRWGSVSDIWSQINESVLQTSGFAFGEYGVWLLGYHVKENWFGIMAKDTFFGDWGTVAGKAGESMADIDTPGSDPTNSASFLGRGALFIGDQNNYRFSVDEAGRLNLHQLVAGSYQIVQKW